MAITRTDRFSYIDLSEPSESGSPYQQVVIKEGNKVTVRIPSNAAYGSGTFANLIKFTITLQKEGL